MTGEIYVNYNEVYRKTAEMRQRIEGELRDMETAYRQATQNLRQMDGKTNGIFLESMEDNRRKAQITANTLRKLLAFMDDAARTMEQKENAMARTFTATRVSSANIGGARNA